MQSTPRKPLSIATGALILAAATLVIVALLQSLLPSNYAQRAPRICEVVLDDIPIGTTAKSTCFGRPIIVFRPDEASLNELKALNPMVWGKPVETLGGPDIYVYEGISPNGGCSLLPLVSEPFELRRMPLGWKDPCRFGAWDRMGRALKGINSSIDHPISDLKPVTFYRPSSGVIRIKQ